MKTTEQTNAGTLVRALRAAAVAVAMLLPVAGVASSSADIKLGDSCVTAECHGDVKSAQFLHGPMNLTQCEPCHIPVNGKHEFTSAGQGSELCKTCHDVESGKAVVHEPFRTDCTLCHDPHGGSNRHFVKGGEGAGQCLLCHEDPTKSMSHVHGPVAAGECLACHTPHQSDIKGLLAEPRTDLCLGCHIDVGVALESQTVVHKPVETDCAGCHDPHGGNAEFFLPGDGGPDLCKSCHGDFLQAAEKATHPHGAMTEGKACRNCHAPHASSQIGLLATNTQDLCLSCHNREQPRAAGGTVDNIAAQLANAKSLHGPIREKNCVACHQAHGSDFPSILRRAFPPDFYAPYEEGAYDLCFECHDRTLVEQEQTQLTGFRNGDRNLHFLHVNREKGRTCRACHEEHASMQDVHIRSEVPFGRWNMKIEYTKTDTGGTCSTGCHVPYSYDRVTPVEAVNP